MKSKNTETAYEFIRDRIVEGIYPPGHSLPTVELAAEINFSRTPVREALKQLQIEGLVEIKPGMGASVRSIDAVAFRELCEVRLALESCAAELAALNQARGDLIEIENAFEAMERLVAAAEKGENIAAIHRELGQEDIRFHFAIFKAAHNSLLKQEIMRLHLLNRVVRLNLEKLAGPRAYSQQFTPEQEQDRRKTVLESHRKIFLAIKTHGADAARCAMHEHISDIVDRSMRTFAKMESRRDMPGTSYDDTRYTAIG